MKTIFYEPKLVGTLRHPDTDMAKAYGRSLRLSPHSQDKRRVMLVLVDPQLGFLQPGRPLFVPGSVEDTIRTVDFILNNMAKITTISASLDSHLPFHIFFPEWWADQNGQPLSPFTIVTLQDLKDKKYKAVFDFQYEYAPGKTMLWSEYYVTMLEQFGKKISVGGEDFEKKNLMVWPNHCLLGTPEHAIEPTLYEAIIAHSIARWSQPKLKVKGTVAFTENFSLVESEVEYAPEKDTGLDEDFLQDLAKYHLIYIAGQAKSHCVLETIYSIIRYFKNDARDILSRIRILVDCTSAVGGFEAGADAAFEQLSAVYGLKLVKSTDPIG